MASPTVTFSITAPGYYGLNTNDSVVDMDPKFSIDASNCIIDRYGRVGARKGWTPKHTSNATLGTNYVTAIGELVSGAGARTILCAGNNRLFKYVAGTPNTLVELTYGGGGVAPTITANNWQLCQLNGAMLFWQRGYDCLIYDPSISTTAYRRLSEHALYSGSAPQANCGISAYGRIWAADTTGDKNTVYWSDTLTYMKWTGGTSGSLNLHGVWPQGGDQIVALGAHNDRLIIFGRKQTLIYRNADNPLEMELEDAIGSTGCFGRDTVVNTPADILFLSDIGVTTLKRTIQEKSSPVGIVSKNVHTDIQDYMSGATVDSMKAVYSPIDSFYLLTFSDLKITYCFDTRGALPDGSYRATFWHGLDAKSYCYSDDQVLMIGTSGYIGDHSGYDDNGSSYLMTYYTSWIDFGDPVRTTILKKISSVLFGEIGQKVTFRWGFDYDSADRSESVLITSLGQESYYNVANYGVSDYSSNLLVNKVNVNASGYGKVVQIGVESQIDGSQISVQKLDIFTKNGAYIA